MIGKNIKAYREMRNMTQTDLAEKLFVSQQAIDYWEQEKTLPQADRLYEIAEALEVPVECLFYDDTKPVEKIEIDYTKEYKLNIQLLEKIVKEEDDAVFKKALEFAKSRLEKQGKMVETLMLTEKEMMEYREWKKHHRKDVEFWRYIHSGSYHCILGMMRDMYDAIMEVFHEDHEQMIRLLCSRSKYTELFNRK